MHVRAYVVYSVSLSVRLRICVFVREFALMHVCACFLYAEMLVNKINNTQIDVQEDDRPLEISVYIFCVIPII